MNIEDVVVQRINDKLDAAAPGVSGLGISDTLIELLMDLLASCFNKPTAEEAVTRVQNMSTFERKMLESRLTRRLKDRDVPDARRVASVACTACQQVAKEATPEERLAFAQHLLPMTNPEEYQWI